MPQDRDAQHFNPATGSRITGIGLGGGPLDAFDSYATTTGSGNTALGWSAITIDELRGIATSDDPQAAEARRILSTLFRIESPEPVIVAAWYARGWARLASLRLVRRR